MSTQFKYRAVTPDGRRRKGTVTANESGQVVALLEQMQLTPLRIVAVKERPAFWLFGFLKRTDYEQLIIFTSNLSTMYKAGIPLLRALSLIRVGKPGGRFNQAINQLRVAVQSGMSLSEAMRDFPQFFSPVYTSGIAAGEESGQLEFTLDELSDMLETEMQITRQIKTAIRYPFIVVGVIFIAIVVLMTLVIPRFMDFYSAFGAELPLPTRIIIAVSNFATHYWPLVLVGLVAIAEGFRRVITTDRGRTWFDLSLLRIPVIGELIAKGAVARFLLMLRLLFAAGVPLVRSLHILSSTVRNTIISSEIQALEALFRRGGELRDIMPELRFIPEQALQMMAIGLESGNMDRTLREVGRHYLKEVSYMSRMLTTILEPILTVVLGVMVLILALAIFLPMWNLIHVLKG